MGLRVRKFARSSMGLRNEHDLGSRDRARAGCRARRPVASFAPLAGTSRTGPEPSALVDRTAMSDRDDYDQQYVVLHGVDDAVVAHSHAETRSVSQGSGGGWSRIASQECNRTLDAFANLRIKLAECSGGGGAKLDPVVGHDQPRSALTSAQGMLSPSSAIASSKAATSSLSSSAVRRTS